MTIRVSPERTTLSLPFNRLKSEDARGPAAAAPAGKPASPSAIASSGKAVDAAQLRSATALLDRASSIADTALAATDTITELLERMRELAAGAREPGPERDAEFRNLGSMMSQAARGAIFDGVNLLDGSQSTGALRVPLGGEAGDDLSLSAFDLTPGRSWIEVTEDSDPASALEGLDTSLTKIRAARERLSDDAKGVEAHRSFVHRLADVLGADADAGLGVEGARLAALQLKQSLSEERFAIANQAPQTVLALFR